jgi:hypothetical protein
MMSTFFTSLRRGILTPVFYGVEVGCVLALPGSNWRTLEVQFQVAPGQRLPAQAPAGRGDQHRPWRLDQHPFDCCFGHPGASVHPPQTASCGTPPSPDGRAHSAALEARLLASFLTGQHWKAN